MSKFRKVFFAFIDLGAENLYARFELPFFVDEFFHPAFFSNVCSE